jgi:uncharacterized protein YecT (DUF1311 family)
MATNWRRGGLFAAGLAAGLVAALAIVGATRDRVGDDEGPRTAAEAPAAATTVALAPEVNCRFSPIVPAAGREDGLLPLDKDLQGRTASAVNTLILSGKEAAAAGKPRDAETAFLMACRSAEDLAAKDTVPLADAHYQLGRHYAQVAAAPDVAKREEMLKRAHSLYASSLALYRKHKGPNHERTKFAQQGLEQLQQLAGGTLPALASAPAPDAADQKAAEQTRVVGAGAESAPQAAATPAAAAPAAQVAAPAPSTPAPAVAAAPQPAAPAPAPAADAKKPAEAERTAAAEAAKPESRPAPQEGERVATAPAVRTEPEQPRREARRTSPSFDCSKARSTTEKLICADEDLARQDRELGRIHDRARRNAADRDAFERASDAEWARREATCQDRECLQRWYAQRRAELGAQAEAERPAARPQRPARMVEPPAPAPASPPQARERDPEPVREVAPAAPAAEIVIDGPATASGDIQ